MAHPPLTSVLQSIRRLISAPTDFVRTDGELLEQFVATHEESAFAELLQRYGPMVLGVCRRVLNNAEDADDAFQATFLILIRRAGALDKRGSLGSWLYTVAYHTALKARMAAARRREEERQVMSTVQPAGEPPQHELRPILDEELHQLPEKYRTPRHCRTWACTSTTALPCVCKMSRNSGLPSWRRGKPAASSCRSIQCSRSR